jgi:hypothetical protein
LLNRLIMSRSALRASPRFDLRSSLPPNVRGTTDALVQGSLVDLFAAYGVAAAPQPRLVPQRVSVLPELSASVGFTRLGGRSQAGRLTLSIPPAVAGQMRPDAAGALKLDWVRELANQLTGRLKNRLSQFSVRLVVAVSASMERSQLEQQLLAPGVRAYAARMLRGEVLVTVDGLPEDAELSYSGPATYRNEGDAILF